MTDLTRVSGSEAREAAREAARRLAREPSVQLVYLFGSAARRDQSSVEDIDLAVLSDPPLDLEARLRLRAELVELTGAPIDLVPLEGAPIVLAWEIVEGGQCLFARSEDVETELVLRTRMRYLDFKPLLDEQWRLAGERARERLDGSQT